LLCTLLKSSFSSINLKSKPDLIKPNIEELEDYFNEKFHSTDEMVKMIRKRIISNGIQTVVVSLGVKGSILVNKDSYYKTKGLEVKVESTVGAGDAMVAGIAYSIKNGYGPKKQLLYGTAAATANIMTPGTQTGDLDKIKELLEKISIKKEMSTNENN
jgi:1-phosphofructokinase